MAKLFDMKGEGVAPRRATECFLPPVATVSETLSLRGLAPRRLCGIRKLCLAAIKFYLSGKDHESPPMMDIDVYGRCRCDFLGGE